jgi:hypothetical protein
MFFWPTPEIITNLNENFAENIRTQPPKLKFSLKHNPSLPKGYLIRLSYTWGDAGFIFFGLGGRRRKKVGNHWSIRMEGNQ